MAAINPDSLIYLPDGSTMTAGVLAYFGGATTNPDGTVNVNADTVVGLPGGGTMTAGAIEYYQSQQQPATGGGGGGYVTPDTGPPITTQPQVQPTGQGFFDPVTNLWYDQPVSTSGQGSGQSAVTDPVTGGTVWEGTPRYDELVNGGGGSTPLTRTRTEYIPGTPGAYARGATPLPATPGDLPPWAVQAFFGGGLTFDDFGQGVQGGTAGQTRTILEQLAQGGTTVTSSTVQSIETTTPGVGGTAQQADAFASVKLILDQAGLGGLAGWAWEQIVNGDSADELYVKLRQTQPWQQRFGAITEARQKAALPAMSEAEIMQYESNVRELFRSYGMPAGFYDQADDIAFLAGQNLSIGELNDRIVQGFAHVQSLPGEVRSYFADVYGPNSDPALAAFFLDPDKAMPVLERDVAASVVGGIGRRYGFDIGQTRAEDLASFGVDTVDEAATGFARVQQVTPLLTETISEKQDFTAQNEGMDFAFGLGGGGDERLRNRQKERVAAFAGSTGAGGARTNEGLVGLGEAR